MMTVTRAYDLEVLGAWYLSGAFGAYKRDLPNAIKHFNLAAERYEQEGKPTNAQLTRDFADRLATA